MRVSSFGFLCAPYPTSVLLLKYFFPHFFHNRLPVCPRFGLPSEPWIFSCSYCKYNNITVDKLDMYFFIITVMVMARPKKPKGYAREKLMQVRVQDGEYKSFKEAADAAGLDLSGWVRSRLRDAALKDKKKYIDVSD
jgi:hypothetical protein